MVKVGKREETPPRQNIYFKMYKRADKCKQRYVDRLRDRSQLTCLIHGTGNSSDECKVINNFGT